MLSYLFCQTTNFKRHLSIIHGIKSKLTAVLLPPRRGAEGEKASADAGGRAEGAPPYHLLPLEGDSEVHTHSPQADMAIRSQVPS